MEIGNCILAVLVILFFWVTGLGEHIIELLFTGKSNLFVRDTNKTVNVSKEKEETNENAV